MHEITHLLNSIEDGDSNAADKLLGLVYEDLRQLAAHYMAKESPGHTLQATALVHDAWLRITSNSKVKWNGRRHFFGAAAKAMRRILIERARKRKAQRHGGDQKRVDLEEVEISAANKDEQLLALNDVLGKLAVIDQPKACLVELRYFTGLTIEETARLLGISEATAKREWSYARAWLMAEIITAQKQ